MNKAQKVVVGFIIVAILVIAVLFIVKLNQSAIEISGNNILYYSFTCPHCKIVEQFIADNNITSKINITQKEVSLNNENANELVAAGKLCKIQNDYIGAVPLLYSGGKCYLGDVDIIDFLKAETGVK